MKLDKELYINKQYGNLTIIEFVDNHFQNRSFAVKCLCDCNYCKINKKTEIPIIKKLREIINGKIVNCGRKPHNYSDININDVTNYIKDYNDGNSIRFISLKYKINYKLISDILINNGYEIRSNAFNSKVYSCDQYYFEIINTPEKAYWLGFLYADGFVTKDGKFGLSLKSCDEYIIYQLKNDLKSDSPIKKYITTGGYKIGIEYSKLLITDYKMRDDLIKHGVFLNKTNIVNKPNINNNLIRHFIRGYFDGDGSIYRSIKNPDYNISFCGTDKLLTFIHNYFFINGFIKKNLKLEKRRPNHIVSSIRYGGNNQVLNIMNHLYKDATRYLIRKYNIYQTLYEQQSNFARRS
jgi:hypothetical protein